MYFILKFELYLTWFLCVNSKMIHTFRSKRTGNFITTQTNMCQEFCPQRGVYPSMQWAGCVHPLPPQADTPWVDTSRWPLKRAVRILLECILVINEFFTICSSCGSNRDGDGLWVLLPIPDRGEGQRCLRLGGGLVHWVPLTASSVTTNTRLQRAGYFISLKSLTAMLRSSVITSMHL